MKREKDICAHLGLPPSAAVQLAYDALEDAHDTLREVQDAYNVVLTAHRDALPLLTRLTFSALARCRQCNAGLAYDPNGDPKWFDSPFKMASAWFCSAELLDTLPPGEHHESFPFAMYEIKSENQPSANGATTRPKS